MKSSSELANFAIETVFSGWFWHKLGYLVSLCQVATCQLPCQSLRACWWSTTLPRRFSTARPGRFGPRTATSVAQLELCQQHLQALERRHCCWERQFCQEHWWLLKGRMANLSHLETTQAISCSTQRICRSTKWHLRSSLSWANTRWCMRGSSLMPWSMKSRRCRLWRKAASHGWSFALVLRFLGFWLKGFRFLVLGSRVRHGNAMAFQSEPWLGTTGSARPENLSSVTRQPDWHQWSYKFGSGRKSLQSCGEGFCWWHGNMVLGPWLFQVCLRTHLSLLANTHFLIFENVKIEEGSLLTQKANLLGQILRVLPDCWAIVTAKWGVCACCLSLVISFQVRGCASISHGAP